MSSALTGNKIKDSYQALLKIGTNGSLDPIVPISITDGLGNDTPLLLSATLFKTQVVSANKDYGLQLDLSANSHIYLGDYSNQYNGTSLYLSDFNQLIQTYGLGSQPIGLKLDFTNDFYSLGDPDGVGNSNCINIDNAGNSINLISQSSGTFLGKQSVVLESQNKQILTNDGFNQLIYTENDNGTYAGERGLKLDFLNDDYQFGDFNSIFGYRTSLQIIPGNKYLQLINSDNYLELDGNYNNVWLGYYPGSYNFNNSAVSGNYMLGTDWQINNNDSVSYLFQWNTILNCYNSGLDTETKHMENNFFINISDPDFDITSNPGGDDRISNCLIFGLTDYNSNNSLNIWSAKGVNTNVVILNGTGMQFVGRTDTYFSVNASDITFELEQHSGINIIGGDFVFKDDLRTANHRFTQEESYAINVQGRYAKPINNFSYVTAEYFPAGNTSQGQVQVEEKHLYKYYDDGSVLEFLKDWVDDARLWLQNNSTYRVTATIVSTTGSGLKSETGNATTELTWMVCVNSSGAVDITDPCEGCRFTNGGFSCNLTTPGSNQINIWVRPDSANGNACHVKGVIKLNCITTG